MDPKGLILTPAPASALDSFLTPAAQHAVIAHHGVARCHDQRWGLVVDGLVSHPLHLDLDQLRACPAREVTAVLECAGDPERPDRPTRLVSNAVWRGVPLASVLEEAGVGEEATHLWLSGEDWGHYAGTENDSYLKDIPLAKACDTDVLLAYELNGEPLSAEHGFPLRLVVPGYYGTNWVKWLSRVSVRTGRPSGLFTTRLYTTTDATGHQVPVWHLVVNSMLTWPLDQAEVDPGPQELRGWAWGHDPVAEVHVSVDGGRSWQEAELENERKGWAWQRFRAVWHPSGVGGTHILMARATDTNGASQPEDLHINQVQRVTVTVSAEQAP
jgi:DMSO/TMAO reductase YedYZ molybdopterin-dependent catalytic subunit